MRKNNSKPITEAIRLYLKEENIHYFFNEECDVFIFYMPMSIGFRWVQYMVYVYEYGFTTYGVCPIWVDSKDEMQISRMQEFITRANYGLRDGNFEMDIESGEIRYKSNIYCGEEVPSKERLVHCLWCPGSMIMRYCTGIMESLYSHLPVIASVYRCDNHRLKEDNDSDEEDDDDDVFEDGDHFDEDDPSDEDDMNDLMELVDQMNEESALSVWEKGVNLDDVDEMFWASHPDGE